MKPVNKQLNIFGNINRYIYLLYIFIFLLCTVQVKASQDSFLLKLCVDRFGPGKITTLEASSGADSGEVNLEWLAPGDDGYANNLPEGAYIVKCDTRPLSDFSGDTTSWFNYAYNTYYDNEWLPSSPGTKDTYTWEGLYPGVKYYFAVRVEDKAGQWIISNIAEATAKIKAITDLTASDSGDGRIALSWTSVGGNEYIFKYSTNSLTDLSGDTTAWWFSADSYSQEWNVSASNQPESQNIILTPDTSYYFSVRAKIGISTTAIGNIFGPLYTSDCKPSSPQGLTLKSEDNGNVVISWNANTEPDIHKYLIERKLTGESFVFISSVTHPAVSYVDSSTVRGNTYVYRMRAMDIGGNLSGYTPEKQILVGQAETFADVKFIKIESRTAASMTISWQQVDARAKGYAVESAEAINGSWNQAGFVYSTQTLRYVIDLSDAEAYYRVVTVSRDGSRSEGSLAVDTSEDRKHLYVSNNRKIWIEVKDEFAEELIKDGSISEIEINVTEEHGFEQVCEIGVKNDGQQIEDFIFKNTRKGAKIVFSLPQTSSVKVFSIASQSSANLVIYWHNGVEWVKLGGKNENGQVYTYSRRLGKFGIKYSEAADGFKLNWVKPRIFTPEEGDWRINEVRFGFEGAESEVTIKIFDITGCEIRRTLRREGENVMVWDGKNENGQTVKGGIYIYQVEADGKIITGTIVVAK